LSTSESCFIDIPELDLSIPFSRQQLDDMMSEMLDDIRNLIDRVLEDAKISADSVDLVIRTGGSSQIVAVRGILDQYFPGKVTEHYPFTSVAAGLALASYHNHHFNKSTGAEGTLRG